MMHGLRTGVVAVLVPAFFLAFSGDDGTAPAEPVGATDQAKLEVHPEPGGGVRAKATLTFPVPPRVVQSTLTDYPHWPQLFGVTMRLANLDRQPDRVLTELYIKHAFLPGERRLLCENRELPEGGLVTTLVAGDFKRYARTWKLSPDGSGSLTRAEFDLLVEVETWAPEWLVALELRRQLERHFRILRETVQERVKPH
jgi:hypothetical protein